MADRMLNKFGLPGRLNNNGCITTCVASCSGIASGSGITCVTGISGVSSRTSRSSITCVAGISGVSSPTSGSSITCVAGISGISCLAFRSGWASTGTQPERQNKQRGWY